MVPRGAASPLGVRGRCARDCVAHAGRELGAELRCEEPEGQVGQPDFVVRVLSEQAGWGEHIGAVVVVEPLLGLLEGDGDRQDLCPVVSGVRVPCTIVASQTTRCEGSRVQRTRCQ